MMKSTKMETSGMTGHGKTVRMSMMKMMMSERHSSSFGENSQL